MSASSMAGQIAVLLEESLARAGRSRGLNSLPASTLGCFFEDPLGAVLGRHSPRCDAVPEIGLASQPLWQAMVHGSYGVPGIGRKLHFYEIAGNGTGSPKERKAHLQRVARWVFLFWLNWYHRAGAPDRFDQFARVVLCARLNQDREPGEGERRIQGWHGAYSRIWQGYQQLMHDIAREQVGNIDCPLPAEPPPRNPPFQHLFTTESVWVDALARLAPRHQAAAAALSAAQLLGLHGLRRGVEADWSWSGTPSPEPSLVTVNSKRCSRNSFEALADALRFDRWLSLERRLLLAPQGGQLPTIGIATRRIAQDPDMQTPEVLLARETQLQAMAARLDIPVTLQGSMRFSLGADRDGRLGSPAAPALAPPQPTLDPALAKLLQGPRWELDPRLLSKELDLQDPAHIVLSVRHAALLEQFEDPDLGVLVHLEVRSKGKLHHGFALSHAYEPPADEAASEPRATGRLYLEVQDAQALPFFGTGQTDEHGGKRWGWKMDCSIVPSTGEPVILLRIEM